MSGGYTTAARVAANTAFAAAEAASFAAAEAGATVDGSAADPQFPHSFGMAHVPSMLGLRGPAMQQQPSIFPDPAGLAWLSAQLQEVYILIVLTSTYLKMKVENKNRINIFFRS